MRNVGISTNVCAFVMRVNEGRHCSHTSFSPFSILSNDKCSVRERKKTFTLTNSMYRAHSSCLQWHAWIGTRHICATTTTVTVQCHLKIKTTVGSFSVVRNLQHRLAGCLPDWFCCLSHLSHLHRRHCTLPTCHR